MTEVVNKRGAKYDVYIGRGSPWGNPFIIGEHGSREEVIALYKQTLWEAMKDDPVGSYTSLLSLDGKRLGCFCKPQACHGDVIVAAIEWLKSLDGREWIAKSGGQG